MFSKRIERIASKIPFGSNLADVGCDHGYLIIEAYLNGKVNKAIAIDNKVGPLESAKSNISKYLDVRYSLSSGINDIDFDTNSIVIAGMGGLLINSIIEEGIKLNKVNDSQTYILEPNRNTYDVRKFLNENCFKIIDEEVVYDQKKYYEIIVCKKSDEKQILTDDELMFGPVLLKTKDETFINKYKEEVEKLNKINNEQEILKQKIERIKRVCLEKIYAII